MDQHLERRPAITPGLQLSKGEFTCLWKWVPDVSSARSYDLQISSWLFTRVWTWERLQEIVHLLSKKCSLQVSDIGTKNGSWYFWVEKPPKKGIQSFLCWVLNIWSFDSHEPGEVLRAEDRFFLGKPRLALGPTDSPGTACTCNPHPGPGLKARTPRLPAGRGPLPDSASHLTMSLSLLLSRGGGVREGRSPPPSHWAWLIRGPKGSL